ncbi:hypothetical protein [Streptomyces sp. NPDC051776]|uniref:hypothetical protein n=1 Tax=Streptomyces sp. NPDC051776 TaxID=3155414 RepID=UPI00342CF17B
MVTDVWTDAIRQQLGLGRILPLGGPDDGAWITERAASDVLRLAADRLRGVRTGRIRLSLADPGAADEPAVPPPASALPPGLLRVEAEFAAWTRQPLPETAERLRELLLASAEHDVGLEARAVDLRVTDLLDSEPGAGEQPGQHGRGGDEQGPDGRADREQTGDEQQNDGRDRDAAEPGSEGEPGSEKQRGDAGQESRQSEPDTVRHVTDAVVAVPGVTRLAPALGRLGRAVRIRDEEQPQRRHVEVQLATALSHRTLDVARAVRSAVTAAAAADTAVTVTVAVLVTAVEQP